MQCPKCQFDHALQTTDCLKCGIVFSRYLATQEAKKTAAAVAEPEPPPVQPAALTPSANISTSIATKIAANTATNVGANVAVENDGDALRELKYRALALPAALLVARLVVGTGFRFIAGMLAMVLHESGHAITAWLTGRWAIPTLWVTMRGEDRSWSIVLLVTAAIGFGGYVAWRMERWGWVCAAAAVLLVQLTFVSQPALTQGALIVFGGDGGALVLGAILMAAFYAPRESFVYESWGLRWGLLAIGALAFLHVYRVWTGPYEDIPFGEIEGVNLSDPSLLTEMYGWSVPQLIDRYVQLGRFCLASLAVVYVWGLVSAYMETRVRARHERAAGY